MTNQPGLLVGLLGLTQPLRARLIAGAVELDCNLSLEQQGFRTNVTIFLLAELPSGACSEWGRVGGCSGGAQFPAAWSHCMNLSPWYVRYRVSDLVDFATAAPGATAEPGPVTSIQQESQLRYNAAEFEFEACSVGSRVGLARENSIEFPRLCASAKTTLPLPTPLRSIRNCYGQHMPERSTRDPMCRGMRHVSHGGGVSLARVNSIEFPRLCAE